MYSCYLSYYSDINLFKLEYLYLSSLPKKYSYAFPSGVKVPSGSIIKLSLEPCLNTTMLSFNYSELR